MAKGDDHMIVKDKMLMNWLQDRLSPAFSTEVGGEKIMLNPENASRPTPFSSRKSR